MRKIEILIAHAPDEEYLAERISRHLDIHGFKSVHRGTVLVGDSIVNATSNLLENCSPVVLCGTVHAVGTGWARKVIQAAQARDCRIYPLQCEENAYLNDLILNIKTLPFWKDEEQALNQLINALKEHFPAMEKSKKAPESFMKHLQEFEKQERRVETEIQRDKREN